MDSRLEGAPTGAIVLIRPLCTDLNELLELLDTLDINEERLELEGWPLAKFRRAAAAASAARLVEERPFWRDMSSTPSFVFPPLVDVGLLGGSIIASLSMRELPPLYYFFTRNGIGFVVELIHRDCGSLGSLMARVASTSGELGLWISVGARSCVGSDRGD